MPTRQLSKRSYCLLLIALCFFWTSGSYLSWLYRVMEFLAGPKTDFLCEVTAYLLQALGIAVFAFAVTRWSSATGNIGFVAVSALDLVCGALAIWTNALWSIALFGLLMNVLHGMVAGFYLHTLAYSERERSATVFGIGYGLAVIAAWVLSLIGRGNFLHTPYVLLFYTAAAVASVWLKLAHRETEEETAPEPVLPPVSLPSDFLLLSAAVLSMSLVKNMGFSFPAADIQSGISLELTRILYAVGLVAAGIFLDRKRQYGFLACALTLMLPFIMLALSKEPIPDAALWCLDYFFYGIFSVFRIVLFTDMSVKKGLPWLTGFGLLLGRIGDAVGTGLCLALRSSSVILVLLTGALFIVTAALLFAMYQRSPTVVGVPVRAAPEVPEKEIDPFEQFVEQYGLSKRERDVLELLLRKCSNPEISATLNVSENTVKYHVRNVLQKVDCKNRKELIEKFNASR